MLRKSVTINKLIIITIVFKLLDHISTIIAINYFNAVEVNEFSRILLKKGLLDYFVFVYCVTLFIFGIFLNMLEIYLNTPKYKPIRYMIKAILLTTCIYYIYLTINNVYVCISIALVNL